MQSRIIQGADLACLWFTSAVIGFTQWKKCTFIVQRGTKSKHTTSNFFVGRLNSLGSFTSNTSPLYNFAKYDDTGWLFGCSVNFCYVLWVLHNLFVVNPGFLNSAIWNNHNRCIYSKCWRYSFLHIQIRLTIYTYVSIAPLLNNTSLRFDSYS